MTKSKTGPARKAPKPKKPGQKSLEKRSERVNQLLNQIAKERRYGKT